MVEEKNIVHIPTEDAQHLLFEISKEKEKIVREKFRDLFYDHYSFKYDEIYIDLLFEAFEVQVFEDMKVIDPTSNKKYINWFYRILKNHFDHGGDFTSFKNDIFHKNFNAIQDALKKFEYAKRYEFPNEIKEYKDINKFNTVNEFIDFIDNNKIFKSMVFQKDVKEGLKKVYDDSEVMVFKPETFKAMCHIGKKTQFCNAIGESDFKDYEVRGISLMFVYKNISSDTLDVGDGTKIYKNQDKVIQFFIPHHHDNFEIRDSGNVSIDLKTFARDNSEALKKILPKVYKNTDNLSDVFLFYALLIANGGNVKQTENDVDDIIQKERLNKIYFKVLKHYTKNTNLILVDDTFDVGIEDSSIIRAKYITSPKNNAEFGIFNFNNPFDVFNNILVFKHDYSTFGFSVGKQVYKDLGEQFVHNLKTIEDIHGKLSQYLNDAYNKTREKDRLKEMIDSKVQKDKIRMYDILEENEDNLSVDLETDDYLTMVTFESVLDFLNEVDAEIYNHVIRRLMMVPYVRYLYDTTIDMKVSFKDKKQMLPAGLEVVLKSATINFNKQLVYTVEFNKREFFKYIFKHKDIDIEFFEDLLEDLFNNHPYKKRFDIINNFDDIKDDLLKFVE